MTTDQIVIQGHEHFNKQYEQLEAAKAIIKKYGMEELGFPPELAEEYCQSARNTSEEFQFRNKEEFNRFYTWYFLNYVPHDSSQQGFNWNMALQPIQPIGVINGLQIHPLAYESVKDQQEPLICSPEKAQMWGVFLHKDVEELECAFVCPTKYAARHMLGALESIIGRWKIKLLIDIKDATIRQIIATHFIHLALVDRDILENIDNDSLTDLIKLDYITATAKGGDFEKAIVTYDQEDEKVQAQIRKIGF